jgi:glycosyltransferase involved in cell wall biosynthesis
MPNTISLAGEPRNTSTEVVQASSTEKIGNVLILSSVPPSSKYTGALMLHSMCQALPADKLSCYAVMTPGLSSEIHPDWKDIPYRHRQKPSESHIRHFPLHLGVIESYIKEQSVARFAVPRIAEEILAFAESVGAQKIWCTLEGQTLIRLAATLQKHSPLPLVAQIWDPPGWWLRDNNVDRFSRAEVLADFAKILSNSKTTVAAASWAMAEQYKQEYGCNAIPVIPGLPKDWASAPATSLNDAETLTIGFAGQLYSSEEWICLMQALESVDWKVAGRPVEVRALGRTFGLSAEGRRNIRFYGWRSQRETLQILSDCDILYCPYWFSPKFETESRLSFPSKLTGYLASGRPVLFHGPSYSSPSRFLSEHDAAIQCNSLNQKNLIDAICTLVTDSALYSRLPLNGTKAFHGHLTEEHMQAQFLKALKN